MLDAETSANFKKQEELSYNLFCPYMDQEDKWKKALGQDLYKQNTVAIHPSMRQQIGKMTAEAPISIEESKGITHLLFKDGKGHLHDSWKQGFFFDQNLKYGIFQEQGGPCGILAVVQGFFLKHLLFGAKMSLQYLNQKNFSGTVQNCLALAISDILYNCTNEGQTDVVIVVPMQSISNKNPPV